MHERLCVRLVLSAQRKQRYSLRTHIVTPKLNNLEKSWKYMHRLLDTGESILFDLYNNSLVPKESFSWLTFALCDMLALLPIPI